MNLVQISEHLKDVPMQALAAYANGKDPMVPAYMATGEMQRRETMQQRMAASQQAGQGQKPTVKEQIEQKAGLMSLQAQQQQQAQQQMAQQAQAQPMPAPPETPQPRMQEEEQPEFAMGGIAQLPVDYDFASGGIIAFAKGDQVPVVEESEEEKKLRVMRELLSQGNNPMSQDAQGLKSLATQSAKPEVQADKPLSLQELMSGPATLKAATQALNPQSIDDINTARLRAMELAGVSGKYGDEQRTRLGEEEAQYKGMLKDREFNNTLALLSGIGRGGLGGAAPAYLQNQASQQAADIAQKRRMNELQGNIDAKQREEGLGFVNSMGGELSKQRGLAGEAGTGYAKLAIDNVNAQARADLQYKRDVEMAKDRNASELALQKIREDHDLKRDKINKDAQFALEKFRQGAPTDEQRNFNVYLERWRKNPANKDKQETDAFTQYFSDRLGGQFKENKTDVTGTNQLLVSLQHQLENDLQLTPAQKNEIRKKIIEQQGKLEAAINRGLGGLPAGSNQLPAGFVPDQPGR
jgi:hypothetical protein